MIAPALALLLAASPAFAAWEESPRTVLGLYTPEQIPGFVKDFYFHPLHQRAEMPLNHLGLILEPTDATKGLPDLSARADVRGVILWPDRQNAFPNSSEVCRWLGAAMERGVRVAIVGREGLFLSEGETPGLSAECRRMFRSLGVILYGARTVDALSVKVASASPAIGFEREPDPSETGVVPILRAAPGSEALLRLSLEYGEPNTSDPVVVGPRGGVALAPFWLYKNEALDPAQFRWVTDPFEFLARAMGVSGLPRPDVTTLNGLRVFSSHIDGDGFFNRSEAGRGKISGEVFLSEILERYPSTPITISLIAGYFDLTLYGTQSAADLSRRILSRPNVEPASHGYAHPLNWRTGEVALRIPRYRMDARREIVSSPGIIEAKALGGGSRISLFQWTGDCLPTPEQVALAEKAGLLNINGGGGRFDRRHPSYAYLFPVGRSLGESRQIYAPSFNENEYTDLWSARYYGYRDVIETFERSGSPRRIKPVSVYVHFYSTEKYAAMRSLKTVYDWALAQPLIPVRTTRWVRSARDFYEMRILKNGENRFKLTGGAALRTVRFDDEPRVPDMEASRGVLGWRREGRTVYVSLDESAEREIALSAKAPTGLRLERANFEVEDWSAAGGGVRFEMEGWWEPAFTLAGLKPGRAYRITGPDHESDAVADSEGLLSVVLPSSRSGRTTGTVLVKELRG